jgi:hypothetical protein
MNKFRFTLMAFALMAFTLMISSSAQAQATRTWVSGVGDDANPCSRTAPCKTFAGAISKTADGGEIDALDPAGFGAVTITKSITIDGCCMVGILAAGTTGINFNDSGSGAPNTKIARLRNLSINGAGTGTTGINWTSGKSLTVENCQIFGFKAGNGHGISVALTVNAGQQLSVKNSNIANNLTDGIRLANTAVGGAINAIVDNCTIERNGANGIELTAVSVLQLRNSSVSFNTTSNLKVANASSSANVENSMFQGSPADGIIATAGTVRLRGNHITNNGNSGVNCAGGSILSYQDNAIAGNANQIVGCADPLPNIQKK